MTARSHRELPSRTLADIQSQLLGLMDQMISVKKRNRGKDLVVTGKVTAVYNNLFVLEIQKGTTILKKTYAFTDILSEGIKIEKVEQ